VQHRRVDEGHAADLFRLPRLDILHRDISGEQPAAGIRQVNRMQIGEARSQQILERGFGRDRIQRKAVAEAGEDILQDRAAAKVIAFT